MAHEAGERFRIGLSQAERTAKEGGASNEVYAVQNREKEGEETTTSDRGGGGKKPKKGEVPGYSETWEQHTEKMCDEHSVTLPP